MKNKIFILSLMFVFLFSINVNANYGTDVYGDIINNETTEKINDGLDDNTKKLLDELLIDPTNPNWSENINSKGVFSVIFSFIKSKGKQPVFLLLRLLGILMLCTLIRNFAPNGQVKSSIDYIALCAFMLTICVSFYSLINASISSLKAVSAVNSAVVPVAAAIIKASGKTLAASALNSSLMLCSAAFSLVIAYLITPCLKAYLAMGICAGLSQNGGFIKISDLFKKVIMWGFSLFVTIFTAVLKLKSDMALKADNLALKTAKFVLGSTVPLAGTVLGESLNTVLSSLELVKSSVCFYAIAAIALTLLPLVIEIICYKVSLWVLSAVSDLLLCSQFNGLCELFNNLLSCLQAFLLLTLALFIISLGVAVSL